MPGTKRGIVKKARGVSKRSKININEEISAVHSVTPSNEHKQRKTRSAKEVVGSKDKVITSARFEEDDQVFEIVTEGQQTEFASDDEDEEDPRSSSEDSMMDSGKYRSSASTQIAQVDSEISFVCREIIMRML